jgi:hypothetical protein
MKPLAPRIGKILLLGFVLRIVFLPLFGGEDAVTTAWISTMLMAKGQLVLSNDPAPIFYLHALIFSVFRPIYPTGIFNRFVSPVGFTPPEFLQISILREPGIGVLLALLKLPYLLFDLMTAILLLWLIRNPQTAVRAFKIWLFNPVVLYVTYVFGQFDIVAVFFMVLAFYYQQQSRRNATLLALAIAIFFKTFAIVAVPFFLFLFLEKKTGLYERAREFFKTTVASVTPFALQFLLAVPQRAFYESANYALSGDHLNGFFGNSIFNRGKPGLPLAQGILTFIGYSARLPTFSPLPDVIYLLPMAYLILLLGWLFLKGKSTEKLWNAIVVVFLLVYAFSLFHPQWFLWVQPFLIALVAREGKRFSYLYAGVVALFFVYIWWWDALLTAFLIIPSVPAAAGWPGPMTLINNLGLPAELVINLGRSALSALCLMMSFLILRKDWLLFETRDR